MTKCGRRTHGGLNVTSLHELIEPWWEESAEHPVKRGQLVHAFVPHIGVSPYVLDSEGRAEPTEHRRATVTIRPLRIADRRSRPTLPVAALPQHPGEVWATFRSKVRPCLVLSTGGTDVPKALRPHSSPRWQSAPTILVAPYYGASRTGQRSGWHEPFLDRIRCGEYPQFLLDSLPLRGPAESVLRLDHILPIGRHHHSFTPLKHVLSKDALDLVDEWLEWLFRDSLSEDAALTTVRSLLMEDLV